MAIAPITGILKKKIITDITIGFVCGFGLAAAYWEFEHMPIVRKRDAYYAKLKAEKEIEDSI
jgi:cytochrome c oxidase subunit 7